MVGELAGLVPAADHPGDGTHRLPVEAALGRMINKTPGDTVTVHLRERLG